MQLHGKEINFEAGYTSEELIRKAVYLVPPLDVTDFFSRQYMLQDEQMWSANQLDYMADRSDIYKVSSSKFEMLLNVLSFFAQSDAIIGEIVSKLLDGCELPEIIKYVPTLKAYLSRQLQMELGEHQRAYAMQIEALCINTETREQHLNGIMYNDAVKLKASFAYSVVQSIEQIENPFERFIYLWLVQAVIEAIFFAGSFAVIYYFKTGLSSGNSNKEPVFQNVGLANDYIAKDERLHWTTPLLFVRILHSEGIVSDKMFKEIKLFISELLYEALKVEELFFASIPKGVPIMTPDNITGYLKHVSNGFVQTLDPTEILYKGVKNELDFMDWLYMPIVGDPIAQRDTQYDGSTTVKDNIADVDFTIQGEQDF